MNTTGFTLALIIIIVSVLLAAGCMGQPAEKEQTVAPSVIPTSIPIPVTTAGNTPVPTLCPAPASGSYWITINPPDNVSYGELIVVTGLTNIPAGTALNISVYQYSFRGLPTQKPYRVSGNIEAQRTDNCTNVFAFATNSSLVSEPGSMVQVEVFSLDTSLNGNNFPANLSELYIEKR